MIISGVSLSHCRARPRDIRLRRKQGCFAAAHGRHIHTGRYYAYCFGADAHSNKSTVLFARRRPISDALTGN